MRRELLLFCGLFLALELAAEAQQPGAVPAPLPSSAGTAPAAGGVTYFK
jgi:hypothetical protein